MKCCCCHKETVVKDDDKIDLTIRYTGLFFSTCINCIQTCQYCGQDSGVKNNCFVSSTSCELCDHESCRSCGINVTCYSCNYTACEDCIDNDKIDGVCGHLRMILQALRRKSEEEMEGK